MKKECAKFKIDLTDYAGGDVSQIADIEAFRKHLQTCASCCAELNKLRKTLGVLVAGEPRSERFQKKMRAFKQQITKKDVYDLKELIQANKIEEAVYLIDKEVISKHFPGELNKFKNEFKQIYNAICPKYAAEIKTSAATSKLSKNSVTPIIKNITLIVYNFTQKINETQGTFSLKTLGQTAEEFTSFIKSDKDKPLVNLIRNVIGILFFKD
ncbi:MAG: hypothetical protein V1701_07020 [Planctomycetota bacterium]